MFPLDMMQLRWMKKDGSGSTFVIQCDAPNAREILKGLKNLRINECPADCTPIIVGESSPHFTKHGEDSHEHGTDTASDASPNSSDEEGIEGGGETETNVPD